MKATGQVECGVLHNPQLIEKRDALVAAGVPESKATCQVKGDVLHSPQLIEKQDALMAAGACA